MTPAQRAVLETIAAGEAPDYQTIFGGHKFASYADHPRINIPLGNGSHTSAAGRYQFIAPTWDELRDRLKLKDFSPDNQDAAAWELASHTYKRKTGRELEADANSNSVDWRALTGTWPSLHRLDDSKPVPDKTHPILPPQGGPGLELPESWHTAMRPGNGLQNSSIADFSPANPLQPAGNSGMLTLQLLQAMAPVMKFHPIDYDPWALAPQLQATE